MFRDAEPIFHNIKKLGGVQEEAKSIAPSGLRFIFSIDYAVENTFFLLRLPKGLKNLSQGLKLNPQLTIRSEVTAVAMRPVPKRRGT